MIKVKHKLLYSISFFAVAIFAAVNVVIAQTETQNSEIKKTEVKPSTDSIPNDNATDKNKGAEIDKKDDSIHSIFFTSDEIESIKQTKEACEKRRTNGDQGLEEDDFLKRIENLVKEKPQEPTFTYPQFFLASIAYHSPKDWVIWVNGEKFNQDSGVSPSGLKVIAINNEKATFEWIPERMDKIVEVEGNSKKNTIKVDSINNKVIFSLNGNQTFTTYAMQIVEGKVPPVTINNIPQNSPQ